MLAAIEPQTRLLLDDLIAVLTQAYKDVLAVVLYGSFARHEERPLDDAHPSDVDVLAVFDDDPQLTAHRGMEITRTLNQAYARHVDAPRDVQVTFASRTLASGIPLSSRAFSGMASCSGHDHLCPTC